VNEERPGWRGPFTAETERLYTPDEHQRAKEIYERIGLDTTWQDADVFLRGRCLLHAEQQLIDDPLPLSPIPGTVGAALRELADVAFLNFAGFFSSAIWAAAEVKEFRARARLLGCDDEEIDSALREAAALAVTTPEDMLTHARRLLNQKGLA
jgi:hypothetical protein